MFVSFLFPYKRHNRAKWAVQTPYIRFFYMQLNKFKADEICFIGNAEHFKHVEYYRKMGYWFAGQAAQDDLGYTVPSDVVIDRARKFIIEDAIFDALEREFGYSKNKTLAFLISKRYPRLESALRKIFTEISRTETIEGVITLCNCPSLQKVADEFGIRVIHNENGPLRKPHYVPTFYFDYKGVNGNTECFNRFQVFKRLCDRDKVHVFSEKEILFLIGRDEYLNRIFSNKPVRYKVGLALQVEDDSNLLAFSGGLSNLDILLLAREFFDKEEVLVRRHPQGYLNYDSWAVTDQSTDQIDFIKSCERILTINSSVGVEALLYRKNVIMLGQNPADFLTRHSIDETAGVTLSQEELLLGINFLIFGYLVPYEYLFDPHYYRWRLRNPPETEIYNKHLHYYLANKSRKMKYAPPVAAAEEKSGNRMLREKCALNVIDRKHFIPMRAEQGAKELFKGSVGMVEIEVFSFCNRKCWFCPNSFIDRSTKNIHMDEKVYLKILGELSQIDFGNRISYSRYNEPLADKIILRRIRQARERLPNAKLHTNTNADYLTPAFLEELYAAGLNSMNIQVYLDSGSVFSDDMILSKMHKIIARLGLSFEMHVQQPNEWFGAKLFYKDMFLTIYGRNFYSNGTNRGGLVNKFEAFSRSCPCLRPFITINIDYNGNVMPCCNLRSDAPQHKKYIVGNAGENSVFDIYGSSKFVAWRKSLASFGPKAKPCNSCKFCLVEETAENLEIAQRYACAMNDKSSGVELVKV
jgi:radical SAM protein with 4Fe4S-binding SPASM domain